MASLGVAIGSLRGCGGLRPAVGTGSGPRGTAARARPGQHRLAANALPVGQGRLDRVAVRVDVVLAGQLHAPRS